MRVTDGKGSDIAVAKTLRLPRGSIVVADRVYQDLGWLKALDAQGISLVTRLKRRVRYTVRERRGYAPGRGVTSDCSSSISSNDER